MGTAPASWAVDAQLAGAREATHGVWRLRLPLPWASTPHVNAYAVDARGGGIVLVDCGGAGHPSAWAALEHALGEAGRSVDEIVELVVTHLHADHAGLAAEVKARTGCRLWMPPGPSCALDAVRRPGELTAVRAGRARRAGVPEDRLHRFTDMTEELEGIDWPLEADRDLAPGAQVPSALGPLAVVDTPGHAPAHVALFEPVRRLLFSADLFTAVYTGSFDVGYHVDPVAQWLGSLDAAQSLDAALALPGHGRPIADVASVLEANRTGLARRLDEVAAYVAQGPVTAHHALTALVPDAVGSDSEAWRLDETLAYLHHLVRTGRVTRSVGEDDVARYRRA